MQQPTTVLKQFAVRDSSIGVHAGSRYGSWVVLGKPFKANPYMAFSVVAKCDCGEVSVVKCCNLAKGCSTRCDGCSRRGFKGNRKHGGYYTKLYSVWRGMISRCTKEGHKSYKDYGGRGIKVCDEWRNGFEPFRDWSLANGYLEVLEIDRIEVNGNYEPGNCRWVTHKVQSRNKRNSAMVTAFGETKCISDWAEDPRCEPSRDTLSARLHKGWEPERALTKQVRAWGTCSDAA